MDFLDRIVKQSFNASVTEHGIIHTISMHTTGEPTRIIISGYPNLEGKTLLQKRDCARQKYDHIRKRLMREPRGHAEMYGAILVQETELTQSGDADIGVLFCHNEGYSTMCGHASIALGRFLIDTQDTSIFPRRLSITVDSSTQTALLRLHAPCGVVRITVPVVAAEDGNIHADSSRDVSFLSVPSWSCVLDLKYEIPEAHRWQQIRSKSEHPIVTVDIAFGGAFYAVVHAREIGFTNMAAVVTSGDTPERRDLLQQLRQATADLKAGLSSDPSVMALLRHPQEPALEFLYGVTVVDDYPLREAAVDSMQRPHSDINLCYFADQQLDRSPTGSCVSARAALAISHGTLALGESYTYHSVVSALDGRGSPEGAFIGTAVERTKIHFNVDGSNVPREAVVVRVEGKAWYTSMETFVVEKGDPLQEGFMV